MSENSGKHVSFKVNDTEFSVDVIEGFGNTLSQFQISTKDLNGNIVPVEIYDVKKVGGQTHISSHIKKVCKIEKAEKGIDADVDIDADIDAEVEL